MRREQSHSNPISQYSYDSANRRLVVEFADGSKAEHLSVSPGRAYGLKIALNKRDYWETNIVHH